MPPLRTALELSAREAGARWRAARLLCVQRSWRAVDVVRAATALARLDAEGLHERCEPFAQPNGLHLHRVWRWVAQRESHGRHGGGDGAPARGSALRSGRSRGSCVQRSPRRQASGRSRTTSPQTSPPPVRWRAAPRRGSGVRSRVLRLVFSSGCFTDSSRERSATWAALESVPVCPGTPSRAAHVADRCEKGGWLLYFGTDERDVGAQQHTCRCGGHA